MHRPVPSRQSSAGLKPIPDGYRLSVLPCPRCFNTLCPCDLAGERADEVNARHVASVERATRSDNWARAVQETLEALAEPGRPEEATAA